MKLSPIPLPAPPPAYTLELTVAEIIRLGLLSYRHEPVACPLGSFYRLLPTDLQDAVAAESLANSVLAAQDSPWAGQKG